MDNVSLNEDLARAFYFIALILELSTQHRFQLVHMSTSWLCEKRS